MCKIMCFNLVGTAWTQCIKYYFRIQKHFKVCLSGKDVQLFDMGYKPAIYKVPT